MCYKERILDYLWSVAPGGATNGQIARALGITSQQTVYMTTQELAGRRLIRAVNEGATWVFYALDAQLIVLQFAHPRRQLHRLEP